MVFFVNFLNCGFEKIDFIVVLKRLKMMFLKKIDLIWYGQGTKKVTN
jgi:hypothetical protein